jgi:hypothetical protein
MLHNNNLQYTKIETDKDYKKNIKKLNYTPLETSSDSKNIYILTTLLLKKQGKYIISSYHHCNTEIVFHKSCKSHSDMILSKRLLFARLSEYNVKDTKQTFMLPPERSVDLFKDHLIKCCDFVSCMKTIL